MNDKLKNLLLRTASGVVMLGAVLLGILYARWSLCLLLGLILVGGLWEFYNLCRHCGYSPLRGVGLGLGAAIYFTFSLAVIIDQNLFGLFIITLSLPILSMPLLLSTALFRSENTLQDSATTLMGWFYVLLPIIALTIIGVMSSKTLLFLIFIIWANDVFAYLVGITCGRHRLCERISPKKSWEGFIGGLVGAGLMGYVAALVLEANPKKWILLALLVAVSGVLGDLIESSFKRKAGVKDSGSLIPGHGGVLDRFDALLVAAPVALVLILILNL